MTLQWTIVAVFLYVEMGFTAILLLPWIRAHMWQKLFRSRLAKRFDNYAHVYTWAFAGALLLLFFDAIREVRKYSFADLNMTEVYHTPNAESVIHMRLFRAQRNLYISGFALFLWLIIRRLVGLISREAQLQASADAAMKQAQSASETAKNLMEQADDGDLKEISRLKEEIDNLKNQVSKAELDKDAMKKQAENLQAEYDRLADEHNKLEGSGDKKSD